MAQVLIILFGDAIGGIIIIISNIFAGEIKKLSALFHINTKTSDWAVIQTIRTFMIFVGGLLISTLVGISQIKKYLWYLIKDIGIDRFNLGTLESLGLNNVNVLILVISIVVLWKVELIQYRRKETRIMSEMNWFIRLPLYALLVLVIVMFGIYGSGYTVSGFAYAHF